MGMVSRADVLRHACLRYHRGEITRAELLRVVLTWRR